MHARPQVLHNHALIEQWPAWLLAARGNHAARHVAQAEWVLRRKHDGRYLASAGRRGVVPLVPKLADEPGLAEALEHARALGHAPLHPPRPQDMHALHERLQALGLDAEDYAARSGLALMPEPDWLQLAGFDRYRRPLWLHRGAARAWQGMQAAARKDGVVLEAISGYRSHAYQLGIFERKRARGLAIADILTVNAAPGFSEHHDGRALDIGTPGEAPAEASFETTPAFAWLQAHAAGHGFRMSYPRGNPHGIVYEPWHWYWLGR
jgi:D-alanyl-D-alanine carboxypeptidase